MSVEKEPPISLDQLAAGKLPKRVLDAIAGMELTIEEVIEWSEERPAIRITITDKEVRVEASNRFNLKKLLAVITTLIGAIWTIIQFVAPHMIRMSQP
jgi:hypothetical protein